MQMYADVTGLAVESRHPHRPSRLARRSSARWPRGTRPGRLRDRGRGDRPHDAPAVATYQAACRKSSQTYERLYEVYRRATTFSAARTPDLMKTLKRS